MRHYDRVKESTTTTGTGIITTLGAATQFVALSSVYAVNETFPYAIVGQASTEWETGYGTLLSSTTFARTIVVASSNANALVTFSAGTKDVFVSINQNYVNRILTLGNALALMSGAPTI